MSVPIPQDITPASLENDDITRIPTQASQSRRTAIGGLAKLVTARSNASVLDPGPPPDRGLKAWTQSFMGHLVVFNTWGMISSFGVFQAYYTSDLGMEPSAVSWIGSMQMLGHFSLGMFSGRALDAGFYHYVIIPGMLIAAFGMFMTSLCTQYWQLFLAQGILNGIGCGLQFTPTMSLVTTYFSKNRSVAVAIMASGSATGGLVYPTIARQLLPRIGFAWTFSAFREAPYAIYLVAVFLIGLGQYFAFYYLPSYAQSILGASYDTSVNLLIIMNGVGVLGRLVPSYFADRYFGPYNCLIPSCFLSAIILYCWISVSSIGSLYAFSITYGFFVAGFQGMFPAVLTSLTKDMSKVGTRNGMGFAVIGLATLVGPPLAGALIQIRGGGYLNAQAFGGSAVLIGSIILVMGRASITGWKLVIRA
ncbi:MFS general substrate transporter [Corynespora cassiicola Philippines]|uniref:MFS general substrate transporter n=1 Tax=Corynespora cassiicola Philippines TaxID=1448308 RepID=A0A2T2PAL5_CORCC|nr:MFS general substrate transporter [Corynespora cassiicola Philippines]